METSNINISKTTTPHSSEHLKKVAREFESLFTSMMFKAMRGTVGDNPLLPMSFGEKIYTDMLDTEYAKMLGEHGSFGLANLIVKELEKSERKESLESLSKDNKNLWMLDTKFIPQTSNSQIGTKKSFTKVEKWKDLIEEACDTYKVDKNLVAAIITQESGGNPYAVSRAGAKGLMQLMDTTAQDLGVKNSFSPRSNIFGGVKYLASLLQKFNGNEQLALASYNAGPSAVEKYKGIPPYQETQNYVSSVLQHKKVFENKSSEVIGNE